MSPWLQVATGRRSSSSTSRDHEGKCRYFSAVVLTCPHDRAGFFDRIGLRKGGKVPKKRHKPEEITPELRQAEVELSRGLTLPHACRRIDVASAVRRFDVQH